MVYFRDKRAFDEQDDLFSSSDQSRYGDTTSDDERDGNRRVQPPMYRPNRLRGRVVDRLTLTNRRLALHRVDQWRARHRIGPHAITFYYQDIRDGNEELVIATRMFLDESDEGDAVSGSHEGAEDADRLLDKILRALFELAYDYDRSIGLDPRAQMTDRAEPMHASAEYVGIGVSSVTFPNGPDWEPVMQGIAALNDGTQLFVQGGNDLDPPHVQSTHTLDYGVLNHRQWRWATSGRFMGIRPTTEAAMSTMLALHQITTDAHERGGVLRGTVQRLNK